MSKLSTQKAHLIRVQIQKRSFNSLESLEKTIAKEIESALISEREECAKIAEAHQREDIAREIRARIYQEESQEELPPEPQPPNL